MLTESDTTPLPELRIDIPDALHNRIEAAKPEYLDRKGFICLVLDTALDSTVKMLVSPAAGNRNGVHSILPLQFPPDLEVTSSSPPTEAVQAVPSNTLETSKTDTVVISKKKRSVKTKGCDAFETFWKTYTAFEHRANGQTKPKALEAWNKATKDVTPDQLLEALGKAQDEISDKVANQTFYSSMPDCHRWLKGEQYAVYLEGNTTVQSNNNIW